MLFLHVMSKTRKNNSWIKKLESCEEEKRLGGTVDQEIKALRTQVYLKATADN
jgi:hypothetical protein